MMRIRGRNSMKKFEGLLLCTDLDGTLFKNDKTVSKENLEAIEYFKSEGGLFTFITGRVPMTSLFLCDIVKPNCPYGCINGGAVYDKEKGYLWKEELPKEAFRLIEYIEEKMPQVGVQINTFDGIYYSRDSLAMERFRKVTNTDKVMKDYHTDSDPIAKVLFGDMETENILKVQELLINHPLADKFQFVHSEKTLYEILPKGISKATSLKKLCELMNVKREKTIAVGDYNNDIGMITYAGVGVAVANAVDDVKAVADYITVSNEESAIAAIINDVDTGKIKI